VLQVSPGSRTDGERRVRARQAPAESAARRAGDEEVQREQDEVIAIFERFGWHLAEECGECRRAEDEEGDKGREGEGEGDEEGDKGKEGEGEGDEEGEVDGVGMSGGMKRPSQGERKPSRQVKKSTL